MILTACGKESGEKVTETKQPESVNQDQYTGPVKLLVVTPGGGNDEWFMERYGRHINDKYPNYSFEVIENSGSNLQNLITEGRKIDLIMTSFVGFRNSIKPLNLMADMSDLVNKHQFDLNRLDASYSSLIQNLDDGRLSALPLYDLSLLLYYNKDLFDKFSAEYPSDSLTWEQLYETARALTRVDGGVQYRGFVTAPSNLLSVNQYSLGYLDSAGKKAEVLTDSWKKFIDTFMPLYNLPGYNPTREMIGSGNAIKDAFFKDRTSAMFVMFNSDAPKVEDGINWDAAALPDMSDVPGVGSQPYPVYFAVTSTSEHRDEAFLTIAHLLTDEVQTTLTAEYAQISPLVNSEVKAAFGKNTAQWEGKNTQAVIAKKPAAPPAYVGQYNTFGQTAVNNAMLAIITGEKDMNTALREAEEEINRKVAEAEAAK